jgi:hypothetical protein
VRSKSSLLHGNRQDREHSRFARLSWHSRSSTCADREPTAPATPCHHDGDIIIAPLSCLQALQSVLGTRKSECRNRGHLRRERRVQSRLDKLVKTHLEVDGWRVCDLGTIIYDKGRLFIIYDKGCLFIIDRKRVYVIPIELVGICGARVAD